MILISFNSRDDNLGDKLIFSCLLEELNKHDEVYIFGSSPNDFENGPLRLRQAFAKALAFRLKGSEVLVFDSPGARFRPKMVLKPKVSRKIKDKITDMVWSLIGVKFHVVGISMDERTGVDPYRRMRRYSSIGVRDKKSLELLSGVVNCVNLVPDMAFLRSPSMKELFDSRIAVSLRQETPDNQYDSTYRSALEQALNLVLHFFTDEKWSVRFFSNVIEDRQFNSELSNKFSRMHGDIEYIDEMAVDLDYQRFFGGYSVVLSNRLHVLIPAMSAGLLPIALVSRSHSKIIDLFYSYGLEQFLVYTDQDAVDILESISYLIRNQNILRHKNYERLRLLKSEVETYISSIVSPM